MLKKVGIGIGAALSGYMLYNFTATRHKEFAKKNAPLAQGCPKIGERVNLVVEKSFRTYFVFGATGHSLATCRKIQEHSKFKTHVYRRETGYDSELFYVNQQSLIGTPRQYAKINSSTRSNDVELSSSEDQIPAIAYLGILGTIEDIDAVCRGSALFVNQLNQENPDIQVVHIEVLDSQMEKIQ